MFYFTEIFSGDILTDKRIISHKMNREQFLREMGKDNISVALINFYFDQRAHGKNLILFMPANLCALVLTPVALYSPILTAPVVVTGAIRLNKWSRKKLFSILQSYHAGEPLSTSLMERLYQKAPDKIARD